MKLICIVLFQMVYGIGLEFAALPGEWWLHALLLVIMMITLAYLEVGEVASDNNNNNDLFFNLRSV